MKQYILLASIGNDDRDTLIGYLTLLGNGAVLQGLGVDENVQGSGLQGSLAADGAAAGVGDGQAGDLLSEDLDVADDKM